LGLPFFSPRHSLGFAVKMEISVFYFPLASFEFEEPGTLSWKLFFRRTDHLVIAHLHSLIISGSPFQAQSLLPVIRKSF